MASKDKKDAPQDEAPPVRAGGHVLVDGRWVIEGTDED